MKNLFVHCICFSLLSSFLLAEGEADKLQIIDVRKGDTLSKISKKYLEDPSQWPALLKYNQISNPNLIQPGMKLKVPASLGKKPAAVVVYKSGKAQYARAQESVWKEVFVKLGLYSEDQVKTGPASSVHLQLSNQTILRLQPQSFIIVNKVDKNSRDAVFTLQEGNLHASAESMRKSGGRLMLRTPSAVAAVRGTVFELQASAQSSGLACHEGQVDVSAQKVTVEVPAGMGTFVEKGKAPLKPFRLPAPPAISPAEP
ncbi:MAG: FecR domain-containing protein [Spirochaetota bacterium]